MASLALFVSVALASALAPLTLSLPTNTQTDLVGMTCSPALQTVSVGQSAIVDCNVEFSPPLDLSITHLPQQSDNMEVRRTRTAHGYAFSIIIYKASAENNREYCLTATGRGISKQACYGIAVNQPRVVPTPEAPRLPRPPRPEITAVYTTRSTVEVEFALHGDVNEREFSTEVSVSTPDFFLGQPAEPGQRSVTFAHLRPDQVHTVSVKITRGVQTRTVQKIVQTTPALSVECPANVDVTLGPYNYSQGKPWGALEALRIKCNTSEPARSVHVVTPSFLKVKPVFFHDYFRVVARRSRSLDVDRNGRHCLTATAKNKRATQACFNLHMHRPLAAVIQNVCRTRDCSAPHSDTATKKVIGCYVTGYPLPSQPVTWTYDGQPLSTETHGSWFRKILSCRTFADAGGPDVRLCKIKVNARTFWAIEPNLLRCRAANGVDNPVEASASSNLLNKTE